MKMFFVLMTATLSIQAFAITGKMDKEDVAVLVQGLADANVSRDLVEFASAGNQITKIEVKTNVYADATIKKFTLTTQQCIIAPGGVSCLGGAKLDINAASIIRPGAAGLIYNFDSSVVRLR